MKIEWVIQGKAEEESERREVRLGRRGERTPSGSAFVRTLSHFKSLFCSFAGIL